MSNATADRLNQISEELKGILEGRLQELAGAMRGTEQVTRQIVATEMEIARYSQITADSTVEITALRKDAADLRARAEDAATQRSAVVAERDEARENVAGAERDFRELGTQVADLRARLRNVELESESLRREAEDVAGRVKLADENVARLRRLRAELFEQVSSLSKSGGQD